MFNSPLYLDLLKKHLPFGHGKFLHFCNEGHEIFSCLLQGPSRSYCPGDIICPSQPPIAIFGKYHFYFHRNSPFFTSFLTVSHLDGRLQ